MTRRDQYAVCADMIKESVTAIETARALGMEVRKGRCRCPVHGGDGFNCSLSKGHRGFKCFSMGCHGDVIELVQTVSGIGFVDALKWFNDTFRLGMDIDSSVDEKRLKTAKNRLKRKADKRAFEERIEKLDFEMYLAVCSAYNRMEQQREQNRPRRYSDDWNQAFADAVAVIPELKESIEYFAMQCTVMRQ